ncbi:hypothetical protein SAMN04244548_02525 [Paracoccus pantotrophus]|nr:hypothetical protein SAMN04244548_02525 [Paracoccus pantotrophus]
MSIHLHGLPIGFLAPIWRNVDAVASQRIKQRILVIKGNTVGMDGDALRGEGHSKGLDDRRVFQLTAPRLQLCPSHPGLWAPPKDKDLLVDASQQLAPMHRRSLGEDQEPSAGVERHLPHQCFFSWIQDGDARPRHGFDRRALSGMATSCAETDQERLDSPRNEGRVRREDSLTAGREPDKSPQSSPVFQESACQGRAATQGGLLLFIRFDAGGAWCVVSLST